MTETTKHRSKLITAFVLAAVLNLILPFGDPLSITFGTLILGFVFWTVLEFFGWVSTKSRKKMLQSRTYVKPYTTKSVEEILCPRCDFVQWARYEKCQKCGISFVSPKKVEKLLIESPGVEEAMKEIAGEKTDLYCPECGEISQSKDKFCRKCGSSIR